MSTSRFYEDYERSARQAVITDQICLSCPVRNQCLATGVENGEWGVWGGVYLISGRSDENRNAHKTDQIWDQIKNGLLDE